MNKKINNVIEIVSSILFSLVIISTLFVVNIYAKYTNNKLNSNESVVSSFLIDLEIEDVVNSITISESINYEFTPGSKINLDILFKGIKNEVKVKYTVTFNTLNNLPLEITYNDINLKYNYITGEINPLGNELIENIIIEWPEEINLYSYSGQIDLITAVIVIEQID